MKLNLTPNLQEPDKFYAELITLQHNRTDAEIDLINARLLLVLCNHIGDMNILHEAFTLAADIDTTNHY
ncbi:DUF2783 domain-containing protein [Suttonella ornithocola]|uniref:Protein of uncharacterized function (DUF2783) n=1 Tax=Suttonella ornithocola TaxID=279832 RepID=A0A380MNF8_9GAMM|nr:DUF2783 domain-containing protein [Suttonella ornithocola]SUO94165.1 Protein of uncharacterised function (DUF2783) [Suttonella ornithocola]